MRRSSGFIRLKPGDPLRREPAAIAAGLQRRYRLSGYPGARVKGAFEEEPGRLTLDVEEGHLLEVSLQGLDGTARETALSALGLETGRVLREGDIWAAIARLDDASEGTVKAWGARSGAWSPFPEARASSFPSRSHPPASTWGSGLPGSRGATTGSTASPSG